MFPLRSPPRGLFLHRCHAHSGIPVIQFLAESGWGKPYAHSAVFPDAAIHPGPLQPSGKAVLYPVRRHFLFPPRRACRGVGRRRPNLHTRYTIRGVSARGKRKKPQAPPALGNGAFPLPVCEPGGTLAGGSQMRRPGARPAGAPRPTPRPPALTIPTPFLHRAEPCLP